jgi:hypothetical protein
MRKIKLSEIEIPVDYFELNEEEKEAVCIGTLNFMLEILDKQLKPEVNRMLALESLIESSIITNQEDELYEICAVLTDVRKLING